MYLIIYKKGKNLYFQTANKLTAKYKFLHNFKEVKVGNKNKIESYKLERLSDIWALRDKLGKYGFRMYITETKAKDKTVIIARIDLMNNPFYSAKLHETEIQNDIVEDQSRVYLINTLEDYKECQRVLSFESHFGFDLMGVTC